MSAAHDHDHPKAAPGELDYVRVFVNTLDVETHEEQLAGPKATARWFAERGLLPDSDHALADSDVRQAHELREALRKLLLAHNGAPLDPAAVDAVNAAAKSAELVVRFDATGQYLAETTGSDLIATLDEGVDGAPVADSSGNLYWVFVPRTSVAPISVMSYLVKFRP